MHKFRNNSYFLTFKRGDAMAYRYTLNTPLYESGYFCCCYCAHVIQQWQEQTLTTWRTLQAIDHTRRPTHWHRHHRTHVSIRPHVRYIRPIQYNTVYNKWYDLTVQRPKPQKRLAWKAINPEACTRHLQTRNWWQHHEQVVEEFWRQAASRRLVYHGKKLTWHRPARREQCSLLQQSRWSCYWYFAAYTTAVTHNAFSGPDNSPQLPLLLGGSRPPSNTQPFILSGSINWVVSNFIGWVPVAPSGECSRGQAGAVDSIAVRRVWQQLNRRNPSVYSSATLRGGCCCPPCVADVVLCWLRGLMSILINEDYYYYYPRAHPSHPTKGVSISSAVFAGNAIRQTHIQITLYPCSNSA